MADEINLGAFKAHILKDVERLSFIPGRMNFVFAEDTGKVYVGDGRTKGGLFLTSKNILNESGLTNVWGTITGTLADQTDLQNALDALTSLANQGVSDAAAAQADATQALSDAAAAQADATQALSDAAAAQADATQALSDAAAAQADADQNALDIASNTADILANTSAIEGVEDNVTIRFNKGIERISGLTVSQNTRMDPGFGDFSFLILDVRFNIVGSDNIFTTISGNDGYSFENVSTTTLQVTVGDGSALHTAQAPNPIVVAADEVHNYAAVFTRGASEITVEFYQDDTSLGTDTLAIADTVNLVAGTNFTLDHDNLFYYAPQHFFVTEALTSTDITNFLSVANRGTLDDLFKDQGRPPFRDFADSYGDIKRDPTSASIYVASRFGSLKGVNEALTAERTVNDTNFANNDEVNRLDFKASGSGDRVFTTEGTVGFAMYHVDGSGDLHVMRKQLHTSGGSVFGIRASSAFVSSKQLVFIAVFGRGLEVWEFDRTQQSIVSVTPGASTSFEVTGHGLTTGDTVFPVGVTGADAALVNLIGHTVTVTDVDNFTIPVTTAALTATGTVEKTNPTQKATISDTFGWTGLSYIEASSTAFMLIPHAGLASNSKIFTYDQSVNALILLHTPTSLARGRPFFDTVSSHIFWGRETQLTSMEVDLVELAADPSIANLGDILPNSQAEIVATADNLQTFTRVNATHLIGVDVNTFDLKTYTYAGSGLLSAVVDTYTPSPLGEYGNGDTIVSDGTSKVWMSGSLAGLTTFSVNGAGVISENSEFFNNTRFMFSIARDETNDITFIGTGFFGLTVYDGLFNWPSTPSAHESTFKIATVDHQKQAYVHALAVDVPNLRVMAFKKTGEMDLWTYNAGDLTLSSKTSHDATATLSGDFTSQDAAHYDGSYYYCGTSGGILVYEDVAGTLTFKSYFTDGNLHEKIHSVLDTVSTTKHIVSSSDAGVRAYTVNGSGVLTLIDTYNAGDAFRSVTGKSNAAPTAGEVFYAADLSNSQIHTLEVISGTITAKQTLSLPGGIPYDLYADGDKLIGVFDKDFHTWSVLPDGILVFRSLSLLAVNAEECYLNGSTFHTTGFDGNGYRVYSIGGIDCDVTSPGQQKQDITGFGAHGYLQDPVRDLENAFPYYLTDLINVDNAQPTTNHFFGYQALGGKYQEPTGLKVRARASAAALLTVGNPTDGNYYANAVALSAGVWTELTLLTFESHPSDKRLQTLITDDPSGNYTGTLELAIEVFRIK